MHDWKANARPISPARGTYHTEKDHMVYLSLPKTFCKVSIYRSRASYEVLVTKYFVCSVLTSMILFTFSPVQSIRSSVEEN